MNAHTRDVLFWMAPAPLVLLAVGGALFSACQSATPPVLSPAQGQAAIVFAARAVFAGNEACAKAAGAIRVREEAKAAPSVPKLKEAKEINDACGDVAKEARATLELAESKVDTGAPLTRADVACAAASGLRATVKLRALIARTGEVPPAALARAEELLSPIANACGG